MEFFSFGFGNGEHPTESAELLGGKGAGLAWLANVGVPVPPGFVISTEVWAAYDKKPKSTMKAIAKALPAYLAKLEAHFGYVPLLSVRSGARVSCPGMMDTLLNVGIDANVMSGWINRLGPKCFGESFHRLVTMYGSVVHGLWKESKPESLKVALSEFEGQTGAAFPDAQAQLLGAIEAVFKSWDNYRANFYRRSEKIPREWGTAVTIQAMVFGNKNQQSGTGVLFTRNPDTGGMGVTGEFLVNAQGEDIVAGVRTPQPLAEMKTWNPEIYDQLLDRVIKLENLKKEMLDIEFTIQDHVLYFLQVRSAKRSAVAAIKIATDMAKQGLLDATEAVKRVTVQQFDRAQQVQLDPKFTKKAAFVGIPACSGVVTGKPVFSSKAALNCKEPCILVTHETTPDDIAGMAAAVGVVTMVGGQTCHAAVNARGMNRACIVGVGSSLNAFKDIETLSIDGSTGNIWTEVVPVTVPESNGLLRDYTDLVCKSLGIVPVIFAPPTHLMPQALLYLGDQVLDTQKAFSCVNQTLLAVDRVYLDLVPSEDEQRYLKLVQAHDHVGRLLNQLELALTEEQVSRLVVMVDASHNNTALHQIHQQADIRSVVLSDQEIVVNWLDMNDPAIQKVIAWKAAEGVSMVSIGQYLAGTTSVISIPQALHILGNGG